MPQLLGLQIRNYRALADVKLGRLAAKDKGEVLPPLCCFIGPNGCGKSTLLDALGFLADSLREGVEAACDKPQRGGFSRLRTQGSTGPIEFTLYYREDEGSRPITYELAVDERAGIPVVVRERLLQGRKGTKVGRLYAFLDLTEGEGRVWAGEATEGEEGATHAPVELVDRTQLGLTTLGNVKEHPRIVALRRYIEGWYLSYFVPNAARTLPPAGAQRWLDREGSNIGNVLQYFERQYKDSFKQILERMARSIPGIKSIEPQKSPDQRMLLRFDEKGYVDPFYQQSMSDGTLKMLAYAILLADPEPRPFIGIEEPENGLYLQLIEQLARNLRQQAEQSHGRTQTLVTTHSPYFVDSLSPEQVWLMRKDESGRVVVQRTADIPTIRQLVAEGLPLGNLWYSNSFDERRAP